MAAASGVLSVSRRHSGWPGSAALVRHLLIALALLLLAVLSALAPRLHNAPVDLAPMWLGAGLATLLSLHLRSWSATVLLAAVMWLGGAIAHAQGLPVPGPAVLAAMAAVTALQARCSARCTHRLLDGRAFNPHSSAPERLGLGVAFLLRCVLVQAVLAGAAMAVLQALASSPKSVTWGAVQLGLFYAGASAVSKLLLTLIGGRWVWLLPSRGVACLLGLSSAALGWLATGSLEALYLAPLIALTAGYFGGLPFATLCAATMAASLMLGVNFAYLSPFEGPDGFVVMLLFIWRLVGMGFFASLWTERRQQARVATVRPGALQCRDPEQLLRHFRASAAGPAGFHGWICLEFGPAAADPQTQRVGAPLLSARLHAVMRTVAQVLRPGDGVMPLAHDTLLVVLPGLRSEHLMTVAGRIQAALGRDDAAMPVPGRLTETRVMGAWAVQCLLQSQVYFMLESD
jgi:hypothetical protein